MREKSFTPHSAQRELERLQIEEYIATNRHGPGKHIFKLYNGTGDCKQESQDGPAD